MKLEFRYTHRFQYFKQINAKFHLSSVINNFLYFTQMLFQMESYGRKAQDLSWFFLSNWLRFIDLSFYNLKKQVSYILFTCFSSTRKMITNWPFLVVPTCKVQMICITNRRESKFYVYYNYSWNFDILNWNWKMAE